MQQLIQDLRYAVRGLIKKPGFTFIAVMTLALGIGANSAIFSAINALLLKPLPIPNQDRVVAIWEKNPSRGINHNEVAFANYLDWRGQNHSFDQLAMERWWSTNLTGGDMPERIQGFLVSSNFFDVVGVRAVTFFPMKTSRGRIAWPSSPIVCGSGDSDRIPP
jgi:putative ABC transport system permease protein